MSVLKIILENTKPWKKILKKIVPISLLRKIKELFVRNNLRKLEKNPKKPFDKKKYEDGINLIGDIKAETGLGQSCRLVASVLEQISFCISLYQYTQLPAHKLGDTQFDNKISNKLPYNINLIHINPYELGIAYIELDRDIWDYRYNIAYWLWELEEFPDEWTPFFQYLDEIWAPSEFICNAIRKKTDLPVKCIPYHVETPIFKEYSREDFNLPEEKFLYLMMYDHNSCMERKNPVGVLKAFKQAFDKNNDKVGLVIKVNNPTIEDENQIEKILDGYTNIYFIKETLSRDKVNSLIKCVDVVVSLHRAEGFGLVLAESMLLGTPTIATNWSSNTEFMNKDISCMVDYELITIEKDIPPFRAGNRWANPNIEQTARYMKKLYEDKQFYEQLSIKAQKYIQKNLSMEYISKLLEERLKEIYMELDK